MKKLKEDLNKRLLHTPSNLMGFVILLIGFGLVSYKIIDFTAFTAFCAVTLPFFFYKQESKDDNND